MTKFWKDVFQYALAALIVVGEVFVLFATGVDVTLKMAYHSAFMLVIGYFFGSSRGSSDKNSIIANSTPNKPIE